MSTFEHRTGKLFLALKNHNQWFKNNQLCNDLVHLIYKFTNEWFKFKICDYQWKSLSHCPGGLGEYERILKVPLNGVDVELLVINWFNSGFGFALLGMYEKSVKSVNIRLIVEIPKFKCTRQTRLLPTREYVITNGCASIRENRLKRLQKLPGFEDADCRCLTLYGKITRCPHIPIVNHWITLNFDFYWTLYEYRDSDISTSLKYEGVDFLNFRYVQSRDLAKPESPYLSKTQLWMCMHVPVGNILTAHSRIKVINQNTGELFDSGEEFYTVFMDPVKVFPTTLKIQVTINELLYMSDVGRGNYLQSWVRVDESNCKLYNIKNGSASYKSLKHFH